MDPPQPLSSPDAASIGKLRLMCSYGGQIAPRPNGKSLCYNGGETRIVAVDRRNLSISTLTAHLSRSLLSGRSFLLKYQIPNHDLDSLVSVTTDEDVVNMIEEYERLALSPTPSRLRFFLFPVVKSDSNSGEYDAKSEAWFFDSLRSARIDAGEKRSSDTNSGVEGQGDSEGKCGVAADSGLNGSESILLEMNSSFGSTGSATSVSNLPAAKGGAGEEVGLAQVQDLKVNLPPLDSRGSDMSSIKSPTLVYMDSLDRPDPKISSKLIDAETDISPHADIHKPMQQVYGYALSQPMDNCHHQQQQHLQQQTAPLQSFLQPPPQYIHAAGTHYAPQYYQGGVQASPYPAAYNPYLHQQPQQPAYALNRQYPVYLLPVGQPQQYNMAGPAPTVISSTGPQLQTSPAMMMTSKMAYEGFTPAQSQQVGVLSEEKQFMAAPKVGLPPQTQTQTVAVSSVMDVGAKYGEYDDPLHAQIYKTQPSAPAGSAPFQPMTNSASLIVQESLSQLQLENSKQQVRT